RRVLFRSSSGGPTRGRPSGADRAVHHGVCPRVTVVEMSAGAGTMHRTAGGRLLDRLAAAFILILLAAGSLVLWVGIPFGGLWFFSKVTDSWNGHFLLSLVLIPLAMAAYAPVLFWLNGLYLRVTGVLRPDDDDDDRERRVRGPRPGPRRARGRGWRPPPPGGPPRPGAAAPRSADPPGPRRGPRPGGGGRGRSPGAPRPGPGARAPPPPLSRGRPGAPGAAPD